MLCSWGFVMVLEAGVVGAAERSLAKSVINVMGNCADGMIAVNHRGVVVACNASAVSLLGLPRNAVVGRGCASVLGWREPGGKPVCGAGCSLMTTAVGGELPGCMEVSGRGPAGQSIALSVSTVILGETFGAECQLIHYLRPQSETSRVRGGADDLVRPVGGAPARRLPVGFGGELGLTHRECQVLELLTAGLGNRDISDRLGVSYATVRNHVQHLLGKLEVGSRAAAIALVLGAATSCPTGVGRRSGPGQSL